MRQVQGHRGAETKTTNRATTVEDLHDEAIIILDEVDAVGEGVIEEAMLIQP